MKTKIILVSHGDLAKGMAHSAQMIAGTCSQLSYRGLQPGEHPLTIFQDIKKDIEREPDCQFVIVVDVFGGSVCNHAMELLGLKNVWVLCGMNLPLVVELLVSIDFLSLEEIKGKIENAKQGIQLLSLTEQVEDDKDFF